ncbi:MAG: anti-sigma factor family protein [Omnitrophica WOR_2 bacterium]
MMKTKISPRDIELLSAYLDGEIDPRKRAQLETRLRTNPELSVALEDLRRTRILLRSVKPLKAPRSFKLRPEMVPQKPARPIYPVFQFASAIAGILFVVVLLGDLLGFSPRPSARTALALPTQAASMATALPQQEFAQQTENPAAAPPGQALKSNAIQETETPALNAEAMEAATSQAAAGAASVPAAAPTPEGTEMGIMAEPAEPNVYTNTLPMIQNDTGKRSEIPTEANPPSTREGRSPAEFPYLRVAEVALGLLAVGAGLVGFYLKRGNG